MSPETAGYSGTPLPRKLGIGPGARVALSNAPAGFEGTLGELPPGVELSGRLRGRFEVIVAFAEHRRELEPRLTRLRDALEVNGGLWLAWPKRASGLDTDLSEGVIRELGLATGLVDNKVCAIDATWSGLRFVYRRVDRPVRPAAST